MPTHFPDPIGVALKEDIGAGDITSKFFVPPEAQTLATIVSCERTIVAGTKTAAEIFRRIDPAIRVRVIRRDGSVAAPGDSIIELRGKARAILKGERVALNFLQRLCGIATLTRKFVEAAGNRRVKILDTRKTTPGLRALEKAAVVAGGGRNHRSGLFDMVLVKDNHFATRGGLSGLADAIRRVRSARPGVSIEIEADTLTQVQALLEMDDLDLILLDNMTPAQMRKAVALRKSGGDSVNRRIKFEASGGITLRNIRQIAATGVDCISVGALTHSAPAINLSLEIKHVAS